MRAWLAVLVIFDFACGGSTTGADASVDGSVDASSDAGLDAPAADAAPADANGDAAQCASLAPMACTQCCIDGAGGTGGFELLYNGPCTTCASCGPNVRPCGTNMSPPASGACILCLRPSLMQGQAWTMCQQSPACKAFVACFAGCPTN